MARIIDSEREETETVMLHNGQFAPKPLVMTMGIVIEKMFQEEPMAFWCLVSFCRRETTAVFGVAKRYLIDARVLESDGSVCPSIRDIVLSSTVGEGMDMKYRNPIWPKAPIPKKTKSCEVKIQELITAVCKCGNNKFICHFKYHGTAVVDGENNWEKDVQVDDAEFYGPYTCTECGEEYSYCQLQLESWKNKRAKWIKSQPKEN